MSLFIKTNIFIKLNTGIDLSTATETEIHYKKPDGSVGEWVATVEGEFLVYNVAVEDIDIDGRWRFQTSVVIGGNLLKGEIVSVDIETPIKTT